MLPVAIGLIALAVWHVRTSESKSRSRTNPVIVGGLPKPYDAKNWDEMSKHNVNARDALMFWSNLNRLEPDYLLPTWLELTGAEQEMVLDAFKNSDETKLLEVVNLSLRRAEPRREDAEFRYSVSELVNLAKG